MAPTHYNVGMKLWQETTTIFDRLAELEDQNRRAALAVLVKIEGSAYRRPGAKLLIEDDGTTMGSVSGGCLEEDVRHNGLEILDGAEPRLLHYDTGSDDESVWGLGLGCDGQVDLFVREAGGGEFASGAAEIRSLLRGDESFIVATVIEGTGRGRSLVCAGGRHLAGSTSEPELDAEINAAAATALATLASAVVQVGSAEVFFELQKPPPYLLICGAGDDALPVAQMGTEVGFRVIVADHRPAYLTGERFPTASARHQVLPEEADPARLQLGDATFAVVKTHSLARDRAWTRMLLGAGVPYVGLLGPSDRRDEILAETPEQDQPRVFGPVGLDLGAEGPEQVAVSIISELLAVVADRQPVHLRDSREVIHARR